MRNLKTYTFVILLGFLFLEVWVGFPIQLEKKIEEPRPLALYDNNGAEKVMKEVHLVESRSGTRDWELFAETAEGYAGQGSWELKNVKVLFYSGEKIEFTVTGKTGRIDSKTKDMQIAGDVSTVSSNGYRFQSASLIYLADTRLLKSPDRIRMISPPDENGKGMQLDGEKMEANVDKSLMRISNGVIAKKQMNDGKTFVIKSQVAEFSGHDNSAKFLEKVMIELDTMRMEGPEAQFSYRQGTEMLQSILMRGGVRVSDIDKYATSEAVRFDPTDNRFTLTGRPRVVQNNDEILGDQIIFIDGGKRVKVENIRARVEKVRE